MTGEATEQVTTAEISAALDNSSENTDSQEPQNSDNSQSEQTQEPDKSSDNQEASTVGNENNNLDEQTDKPVFDNLDAANKGYNNLRKKYGEQSNELGELRKKAALAEQLQQEQLALAKSYGYQDVEEFKNAQLQQEYDHKLAAFEADQYAQFIDECEFPSEMQKLLLNYRNNPSKETLELIEADFPVEVVKQVAASMAVAKGQLQAQQREAQVEQIKGTAKAYLDENVNKYAKEFENEAFVELYSEAFKAYGCDLDTDRFVQLMRNYANTITKAVTIKNGIDKENNDATSEIAGLVNQNNTNLQSITNEDIDKMSDKELAANIRKYI